VATHNPLILTYDGPKQEAKLMAILPNTVKLRDALVEWLELQKEDLEDVIAELQEDKAEELEATIVKALDKLKQFGVEVREVDGEFEIYSRPEASKSEEA
jgi:hypothetical protein